MLSAAVKLKFLALFGILLTIGVICITRSKEGSVPATVDGSKTDQELELEHKSAGSALPDSTAFSTPEPPDTLDLLIDKVQCVNSSDYQKESPVNVQIFNFLQDEAIVNRTLDCDSYFEIISTHAFEEVTQEEREFPIAFSHTGRHRLFYLFCVIFPRQIVFSVHHEIGILEMFLASQFRPVDSHCIHVDPKASQEIKNTVNSLVQCYNQKFPETTMFVARYPVPVFWCHGSVLEADLVCLRELDQRDETWKMFINPAGTEMPMMSHQDMRKWLQENEEEQFLDVSINDDPTRHQFIQVLNRHV